MEISDILLNEGVNMGYAEEDVKTMWKTFCIFDQDGSGAIEPSEVMANLQSLGQNPTSEDCDKILEKADRDGNNRITFLEFIRNAKDFIKDAETQKEDLKNAFLTFDSDRNGYLTRAELRDILTSLGDRMNNDEVNEMFRLVDTDKDDRINYQEFINYFVNEKPK